jgi:hypothetical protein
MLTIFGLPKAFHGLFDVIQRNAIQSWLRLRPPCEIILVGDDEGTARVAAELGLRHIPNVDRNASGTPLLNSMFAEAQGMARYPTLCYVNSDIILLSDFPLAVERVLREMNRFLLVGRRWDLDVQECLAFDERWEARLKERVQRHGTIHGHSAIDYFVFPRGLWDEIPSFAIGRTAWDGWLIYRALSQGVPVIDLTDRVTAVHQNHPYAHPQGQDGIWKGAEAQQNLRLAGGYVHAYTLWDAKYKLVRKGIVRRYSPYFLYRQLVNLAERNSSLRPVLKCLRAAIAMVRK